MKSTKKSLTKKLDKICSEIIRSHGKCERCGSTKSLQCCHIFSRTYRSVRWDLDNLICGCASCHFFWHKNPTLFTDWVYEKRKDKYLLLKEKYRSITKYGIEDLELKYKILKEINEEHACPNCGKSDYMGGDVGMTTLAYFQPHYINGVNVNPDRNTTTRNIHCCSCGKNFQIKECLNVKYEKIIYDPTPDT